MVDKFLKVIKIVLLGLLLCIASIGIQLGVTYLLGLAFLFFIFDLTKFPIAEVLLGGGYILLETLLLKKAHFKRIYTSIFALVLPIVLFGIAYCVLTNANIWIYSTFQYFIPSITKQTVVILFIDIAYNAGRKAEKKDLMKKESDIAVQTDSQIEG